MAIKSRVRECRKALGWSQERLAKESGVSRSAVCDAETGAHMPTIEAALRLARALQVPVDRLFILLD